MDHLTLAIIGILCSLLVISLVKLEYWKDQAKAAIDHANALYKHVYKQSEYIKNLRAKLDAATLHAYARENFVSVSDSATKQAPETQEG